LVYIAPLFPSRADKGTTRHSKLKPSFCVYVNIRRAERRVFKAGPDTANDPPAIQISYVALLAALITISPGPKPKLLTCLIDLAIWYVA
jgi:hypothetical protein